jgi:hypothetical protein
MPKLDIRQAEVKKGYRELRIIALVGKEAREAGEEIYQRNGFLSSLEVEGRTIDGITRYIVCMPDGYEHKPHHPYPEKRQLLGRVHFDGKALGRPEALLHFLATKETELYMVVNEKSFELWEPQTLARLTLRQASDEINAQSPLDFVGDSLRRHDKGRARVQPAV